MLVTDVTLPLIEVSLSERMLLEPVKTSIVCKGPGAVAVVTSEAAQATRGSPTSTTTNGPDVVVVKAMLVAEASSRRRTVGAVVGTGPAIFPSDLSMAAISSSSSAPWSITTGLMLANEGAAVVVSRGARGRTGDARAM